MDGERLFLKAFTSSSKELSRSQKLSELIDGSDGRDGRDGRDGSETVSYSSEYPDSL